MSFFQELKRRNVIRVGAAYLLLAWLVLQAGSFALDVIGAPEWILQVFVLIAVLALPLVLIFAWVYELTPEGIRRESQIDRSSSITPHTGRKLDRVIIIALALAVVMLLADRFIAAPAAPDADGVTAVADAANAAPAADTGVAAHGADSGATAIAPDSVSSRVSGSIAVLPFLNMSADPQNEYFSDGVAEEILNVLARIPELKVTARTSAFTFKGSNATVAQIARELGVNHVLEGSVRKEGNQVRVTAQLIEAANGFHLWSETYDRELTNIFAIQDEIAGAIATQLKVRLLPATNQPNLTGTEDLEAYELYLKGVSRWHDRTGTAVQEAGALFERAVARDPGFAKAHAYLALNWSIMPDYTDYPMAPAHASARSAAFKALDLDPQSIEAATALINATNDVAQQAEYARQAIALNPGFATAHQWYATALLSLGDLRGAEREYRIAQELDPRSRIIADNLAALYIYLGDFETAEQTARRTEAMAPDWHQAQQRLLLIHLFRGDREQAEHAGNRIASILGRTHNSTPIYLDLFFDAGRRDTALAEIATYPRDQWENPENPALVEIYDQALLYAAVGALAEALATLQWSHQNESVSNWSYFRALRIAPDVVCSPEIQDFFANSGLPPMVGPSPCEGP